MFLRKLLKNFWIFLNVFTFLKNFWFFEKFLNIIWKFLNIIWKFIEYFLKIYWIFFENLLNIFWKFLENFLKIFLKKCSPPRKNPGYAHGAEYLRDVYTEKWKEFSNYGKSERWPGLVMVWVAREGGKNR